MLILDIRWKNHNKNAVIMQKKLNLKIKSILRINNKQPNQKKKLLNKRNNLQVVKEMNYLI